MIAKITTGKDIYGVLAYNQEKVNEGLGKVLASNIIPEPEDGRFSVVACTEAFNRWLPSHYRTEKPVIHISLNPHPDDKLTDEQLADIGLEYMQQMGYGVQPYLIFKHSDIGREHIHIVSLQVDSEGKKIKDSKRNLRSVAITEKLEKKYRLHPAKGQKQSEQWQFKPFDVEKGDLKKQIGSVVKPAVALYRFQTMGEYRALLSLYNIGVEEVQGTRNGKLYRGLLYSALDVEGNKAGTPIKSSAFGKTVGFDALEERMEKSTVLIKEKGYRERLRPLVAVVMREIGDETELRQKLKEKDIDLYLRRNNTGRITGVTFIDHQSRCVLNGSRLGKEFSANVFNDLFRESPSVKGHTKQVGEKEPFTPLAEPFSPANSQAGHIESAISSLFSIFSPESESYTENQQQLRKKQKKKKRRYGRQM
ncbi:MAG: mobilization protein [Bacteroidetes bacterium GWF2_42_66]|nr:MAG: mobilization protein [Bacteroidetes bacterium GWA2_42_15]OFX98196.1 MAG: mobilization protein [Bacteroidetes bacterium GWE2_42_39]OFY42581.1 MAG: mobilization protein [Bacteroidetes bacterium GWF2_42_66]HBL74297.1 mobilization protein [Prolixibacteraceae bacterium]HCU64067.1 mobilization protein [Prolixibacteraceae bacterium]